MVTCTACSTPTIKHQAGFAPKNLYNGTTYVSQRIVCVSKEAKKNPAKGILLIVMIPLNIIDLALSAIADTFFVPFDLIGSSEKDRYKFQCK
jgi:uncharacterized protein YceK